MIIWLYRHGKTAATEAQLYCGSRDLPLSEEGRNCLVPLELPQGLDYISSGMGRCDETLEILTGQNHYRRDPRLREIDFGIFELKSYQQLKDQPAYQQWITGDLEQGAPPEGESHAQMKTRALEAFADLVEANRDCFVVTHGGVIAAIMGELFPHEDRHLYSWQPEPGGGYRLTLENGTILYEIA